MERMLWLSSFSHFCMSLSLHSLFWSTDLYLSLWQCYGILNIVVTRNFQWEKYVLHYIFSKLYWSHFSSIFLYILETISMRNLAVILIGIIWKYLPVWGELAFLPWELFQSWIWKLFLIIHKFLDIFSFFYVSCTGLVTNFKKYFISFSDFKYYILNLEFYEIAHQ